LIWLLHNIFIFLFNNLFIYLFIVWRPNYTQSSYSFIESYSYLESRPQTLFVTAASSRPPHRRKRSHCVCSVIFCELNSTHIASIRLYTWPIIPSPSFLPIVTYDHIVFAIFGDVTSPDTSRELPWYRLGVEVRDAPPAARVVVVMVDTPSPTVCGATLLATQPITHAGACVGVRFQTNTSCPRTRDVVTKTPFFRVFFSASAEFAFADLQVSLRRTMVGFTSCAT
jgi:hypothetical protein